MTKFWVETSQLFYPIEKRLGVGEGSKNQVKKLTVIEKTLRNFSVLVANYKYLLLPEFLT